MNMKKYFLAVPLSLALMLPAAGLASAHTHTAMPAGAAEVTNKAVDLRAALDSLLSEHAFLAVVAMQKGIDGKGDFDAAAGALAQNTDDLSKAVASVYGEEGGAAFKEIWSSHIGYFVDYVKATGAKDDASKKKALAELDGYRVKQAAFLDSATGSRLKAKELEEGLKVHINQLVWAFDNYVAGDFDKTYDSLRESVHHMYGVGKGLSWAIKDQFPDQFDHKTVDTPAAELRANLNHLFSEHAALAILAMQKGIDGAKDFDAAAAALNENTDDLSAAIASVYGKEGGEAFKKIWSSHIGYFVDYVKATGAKDEAAKSKALAELDQYRVEQAAFLDAATEGRLKASDMEAGLKMHVDELLKAFNSYSEMDYATAYPTIREAYSHMFEVGLGVTSAVVDQFPDQFAAKMPSEMPQTGMGGMSHNKSSMTDIIMLSLAVLALASLIPFFIARRKDVK
ncbi:copper amine oxidase [Paenibacillus sp. LHD-38]|uniref:copper amine oxidase n=1 Tax=Paenibacillus sp. LHD-38 TaxID=3072143 RepID=UPI00280F8467|nr:copper amine oxidase [Paenibacillus sp. LHD-38]MDQ8734962.1 copper amine oxidase [Paenibacillus sp. LHD-38]